MSKEDTMINVGFAELHSDLFLGGKNFGKKLDPSRHGGIKLVYDRVEKELLVSWAGKTGYVPAANISVYIPGAVEDRKVNQMAHPMVAGITSAQVETPMSHVHAGQGFGKTGK